MRKLRIARAEDGVPTKIDVEFVFERLGNVDFAKYPKAFNAESRFRAQERRIEREWCRDGMAVRTMLDGRMRHS